MSDRFGDCRFFEFGVFVFVAEEKSQLISYNY
jgi:hypothetical protein